MALGILLRIAAGEQNAISRVPADMDILGVVATRYALLDHGIDEYPPVYAELDRLLELIERARSE